MAKFEDDLAALEQVVERLEHGDLSLEESVDLYEQGVLLSRACRGTLNRLDARVQALVDPEGDARRVEDVALADDEEDPKAGEEDLPSFEDLDEAEE